MMGPRGRRMSSAVLEGSPSRRYPGTSLCRAPAQVLRMCSKVSGSRQCVQVAEASSFERSESEYSLARLVRTFPNVRVAYLDYTSHFKDTALDLWLREGAYKRGPYEVVHVSDGLRLGLLLKHGGVYVDMDVIFLRSLSGAGDALVAQSAADSVTNNFLAFPARHSFVNECLAEFVSGYYPKDWGYNGPRMIRKTLLRWCNASRVEEALGSTDRCRGVTLLPQARLLPLNHTLARMLFEAAAWRNVSEAFARSHLVHTFNSLTRGISAQPGSFVDRAARQNCPRSFRLANELYGMF
ncbi:lactosylceramide 4-alpha-galactosyltransferase-like [Haemaphysalis longicornis]